MFLSYTLTGYLNNSYPRSKPYVQHGDLVITQKFIDSKTGKAAVEGWTWNEVNRTEMFDGGDPHYSSRPLEGKFTHGEGEFSTPDLAIETAKKEIVDQAQTRHIATIVGMVFSASREHLMEVNCKYSGKAINLHQL